MCVCEGRGMTKQLRVGVDINPITAFICVALSKESPAGGYQVAEDIFVPQ